MKMATKGTLTSTILIKMDGLGRQVLQLRSKPPGPPGPQEVINPELSEASEQVTSEPTEPATSESTEPDMCWI